MNDGILDLNGSDFLDANGRSMDRDVLIELFGQEIGAKLFGAAVKLSERYGISLDDVVQEISLAGMEVLASYGYCNINVAVNHAKDALIKTNAYGLNLYQVRQGRGEVTVEIDEAFLAMSDEGFDWDTIDLALSVQKAMSGLNDETDRAIALRLAQGLGVVEMSDEIGLTYTSILRRRDKRLSAVFEGIL